MDIPIKTRTRHPEKCEFAPELKVKYTDYFTPVSEYAYFKMIYYQLVKMNSTPPAVHLFEDGSTTYTDDLFVTSEAFLKQSLYSAKKRFFNNLVNIFLYQPSLYCGRGGVPKIPIPQISEKDTDFISLLESIFGEFQLPKERYLFFNECFNADGASNDIQILDAIAEIVGKSNIVVKMHPRSLKMEDLYRLHGYKIFSDKDTPWELAVADPEINNKVLLSISSNATWTPLIIGEKKPHSISLLNVMKLSRRPHARKKAYIGFMNRIKDRTNRDGARFHMPNSIRELTDIVRYCEGEN